MVKVKFTPAVKAGLLAQLIAAQHDAVDQRQLGDTLRK